MTTTTKASTGEMMEYLAYNNSLKGYDFSSFFKTTTTVTADQTTTVQSAGGSQVSVKTSADNNGTTTTEVSGKTKIVVEGVPATVGLAVSKNSQNQVKLTAEGSSGNSVVQGVTQVSVATNGKNTTVSTGVGAQVKAGPITVKTCYLFNFSF